MALVGGSDGPCWEAGGTPSPSHEPDARGSLGQADAAQECPFLRDQDLRVLLPLVRAAPSGRTTWGRVQVW